MNAKPDLREIATTGGGRDITRGFLSALLPPADPVLTGRGGGDYALYQQVLSDDQVQATFQQRREAVVARDWQVVPGADGPLDQAAADFVSAQLDHIGWDRVTRMMLFGVFYGFAVAECLWAERDGHIALDQIKVRDRRRFRFGGDGRLRLLTQRNPQGEELPERKFWHFATGADHDDEPYGLGLGHWLYWPVFFKRNALKFWLVFLEKFGQPTAKGIYPAGATETEIQKLREALGAIHAETGIVLPEGVAIELIEASRSGTADYDTVHQRMNEAIAKIVLGQTMTTEDGSSRAQAEVHYTVRQDLVKADADLVNESFSRGPARWLTEWNFPGAAIPRVVRHIEAEPDLRPRAERDRLLYEIGFRPSLAYVRNVYGEGWEERG
jgi:phage gp29-like protein